MTILDKVFHETDEHQYVVFTAVGKGSIDANRKPSLVARHMMEDKIEPYVGNKSYRRFVEDINPTSVIIVITKSAIAGNFND